MALNAQQLPHWLTNYYYYFLCFLKIIDVINTFQRELLPVFGFSRAASKRGRGSPTAIMLK
jgi:hypothetical protein